MRKHLTALAAALLISTAALPSAAQTIAGVTPPPTLEPQGTSLALAGCGARETLWMDIYAVALYLPKADMGVAAARSADVAKAVRLYPVYEGDLPEDIPGDWKERLQARLPADQFRMVQDLYRQMTTDDVATLAYRPGKGSILMINDRQVGSTPNGQLVHGVLETWLGEGDPIDLLPDC